VVNTVGVSTALKRIPKYSGIELDRIRQDSEPPRCGMRNNRGGIEEGTMIGTELHVQASVWKHCQVREADDHGRVTRAVVGHPDGEVHGGWLSAHTGLRGHWSRDTNLAVLVMEGQAADAGVQVVDALYLAVLTRGLSLATDLDHLDLRPVLGWRVVVDRAGAVTVEWPHTHPLIHAAPVDLPTGWLAAAADLRLVVVVAGYGLNLATPDPEVLGARLERASQSGALAAGAVESIVQIEHLATNP
jgi:hypothetical protein